MIRGIHLMALVVLSALMLGAQPARQRDPEALKTYLGLSDTQLSSLQQIQQTERTEAQAVRKTVQEKSKALRDQLEAGSTNAAALGQLLLDGQAARKQLEPIRTRAHDQALAVLTPDQKTKLTQLQSAASAGSAARQAAGLGLLTPGTDGQSGRGHFRGGRF